MPNPDSPRKELRQVLVVIILVVVGIPLGIYIGKPFYDRASKSTQETITLGLIALAMGAMAFGAAAGQGDD